MRLGYKGSCNDIKSPKLLDEGEPALDIGIAAGSSGSADELAHPGSRLGREMPGVSTSIRFKHVQLTGGPIPDYVDAEERKLCKSPVNGFCQSDDIFLGDETAGSFSGV